MQQAEDNVIFHKNVTSPATGLEFDVSQGNLINIEFESEGSFSANFEAKANSVTTIWKPVMAANLATLDLATTATDKSYIYQLDLTGISLIRVNLTSVSGSISVYGRFVG